MFNYELIKSFSKSYAHSPSTLSDTTQLSKSLLHSKHDKTLYNSFFPRNIKVFKRNLQSRINEEINNISSTSFKPIILHKQATPIKPIYPNQVYNVLTNQLNYLSNTPTLSPDTTTIINNNTPSCPKHCQHNILQKYKNYKYLNIPALAKLSSNTLDTGFLKCNPKIHVKDISTYNRKVQEYLSRNSNKHKPLIRRLHRKTSTIDKSKLKHMTTPKTNSVSKRLTTIKLGRKNLNVSKRNYTSMRQSLLMDRLILKLVEHDELSEDYAINVNKPFDRYSKFKKICKREKIRVDNIVHGLNKANSVNEELMKVYVNSIKKLKRNYKQDISIFDNVIVKQSHKDNKM